MELTRALLLLLALLAAPAFAQEPIRCPLDVGCGLGVAGIYGIVPPGATQLEWCVWYEEPVEPTCGSATVVAGTSTPRLTYDALNGYRYTVSYRWLPVSGWSTPSQRFINTHPSDVNADGFTGGPDHAELVPNLGKSWRE